MKHSIQLTAIAFATLLILAISCKKKDDSTKSSLKQILSFQFTTLTPVVNATINETNHTITADLPAGTVVTALVPTISVSPDASINPASGVAQNFTNPLNYTVTAEDGSKMIYTVTVTVAGSSTSDPQGLSGTMSSNQTLPNRNTGIDYVVTGDFTIDGNALLTVEPGVTIAFAGVDSKIVVNQNAGLRMVGTAAEPIILTGPVNNQNKGSWAGVEIYSNRADNEFAYVQMLNSGANENYGVIYLASNSGLKMNNCTIDGALGYGLYINDNAKVTSFSNNTIKNCNLYPIYTSELKGIIAISGTNDLGNNSKSAVFIQNSNGLTSDATITRQSVPFLFNYGYVIEAGYTLTIEAGNTIEMGAQSIFLVSESAKLLAVGTSTAPIVFTGKTKDAGFWAYIQIDSNVANKLEYCTIEYGGHNNYSMLYVNDNATATLNNNVFRNSLNYGVSRFSSSSTTITAAGNTFASCPSGNIYNRQEDNTSTNF